MEINHITNQRILLPYSGKKITAPAQFMNMLKINKSSKKNSGGTACYNWALAAGSISASHVNSPTVFYDNLFNFMTINSSQELPNAATKKQLNNFLTIKQACPWFTQEHYNTLTTYFNKAQRPDPHWQRQFARYCMYLLAIQNGCHPIHPEEMLHHDTVNASMTLHMAAPHWSEWEHWGLGFKKEREIGESNITSHKNLRVLQTTPDREHDGYPIIVMSWALFDSDRVFNRNLMLKTFDNTFQEYVLGLKEISEKHRVFLWDAKFLNLNEINQNSISQGGRTHDEYCIFREKKFKEAYDQWLARIK